MITEKDIKRLRYRTSGYHVFGIKYVMPFFALILFAVALANIYLAIECANIGNSTLWNILSFECDQQFPGWCMVYLNRIHLSVFQITGSFLMMIFWLSGIAEIKFYKRMLNFVEEHTNSEKSTCSDQSQGGDSPNSCPSA